jgi:hypothetical protein
MGKSKRTAEDIARRCLIDLERDQRQAWMVPLVWMFFVLCASFALCVLVLPSLNPAAVEIFMLLLPFTLFVTWISYRISQGPIEIAKRRVFLQGFVRGLLVSEPGAPKKWTMDVCKETIAAVQAVAAETGMSVARSIDTLKKRDPERWRSLSEPRYYEAVRQLEKSATAT